MWILSEQGDLVNLALHKMVAKQPDGRGNTIVRTDDGVLIATLPTEQHADELIEDLAVNIMKGTSCIDLSIRIRQLQKAPAFNYERTAALGCEMS